VDCPDEVKFDVVARAAARLKKAHETIDVDGVRVIFPHGWGLVRASNTQPVLVLRFEAENESLLDEYRGHVEQVLKEATQAVGV
jgi:phosphomannomutase/phosphoglucomutase